MQEFEAHKYLTASPSSVDGLFITKCGFEELEVSSTTCTCSFYKAWKFPCRHVFHVRNKCTLELLTESAYDPMWFKENAKKYESFEDKLNDSLPTLNENYAFKVLSETSKKLAEAGSKIPATLATKRQTLEEILKIWEAGDEVIIESNSQLRVNSLHHSKSDECFSKIIYL